MVNSTPAGFGNGTESLDVMEAARRYNASIESEIVRALGDPSGSSRVLDVGAGSGEFALRLRARGYHVTCVEPDEAQRTTLTAAGFEVFTEIDDVVGEFDGAYMVNVLEHIQDDVLMLRAVHGLLVPGAALFVWVPAFEALYSDFDFALGHFRRYSRRGLERTVLLAGFAVETTAYRDSLGWLAALAWKALPRRGGGLVSGRSVEIYDRWVFPTSRLLDRFASRSIGKNVIAIGRRR